MLSSIQKATAQAIVNIFETGRVRGDYAQVTVLAGDSGHLSYGRSQATLSSGNLEVLVRAYVDTGGTFSDALRPWLPALADRDTALDHDPGFEDLLRRAGADPAMQFAQDRFFDRAYWVPSVVAAERMGIFSALGVGVIYDGHIHGSFVRIKNRTNRKVGVAGEIGEEAWVREYVDCRRDWLAHHGRRLLRKTVYRMDAFRALIDRADWALPLPLVIRGVTISETSLAASVLEVEALRRNLRLSAPLMHGPDVKRLQLALEMTASAADGFFGPQTERHVRAFQARAGLVADGVVGPATRRALAAVVFSP